jgi:alkanesulfonate monooxygenase SsuD/methylene tetrahydromethanopterin reductase-like flavin-dependent oxidoreductase (luciferase family)
MARKIATFDHLTNGRLAVHIITGKTDDEQQGDGDFSPKTERYRRAAEYLELMKLAWSSERPFDFCGEFYRVKAASSDVRPQQEPHPLLFFGAASDGAFAMGTRLCDVYAIYAEPLASNASPASGPKQRPSGGRRASTFRCARSLRRAKATPGTTPQHISSGLPPIATVNADIRNRRSVASDQQTELKALFFGFGGEVAVSVIAVSSTEGSSAAWNPTMHPVSSLSAYSR